MDCPIIEEKTMNHHIADEDLLVIVDFQNVYLPGNDWACPSMPNALSNTVKILSSPNAPEYLFTRFLAPDIPNGRWKIYNDEYESINKNEYLNAFADDIVGYISDDVTAEKSTYSSMKCAKVVSALNEKKRVILAGVVAECCILATMIDAIDMGFEVVYLYDCIAGQTEENENMIKSIAESFSPIHTRVMSSDDYIRFRTDMIRGGVTIDG